MEQEQQRFLLKWHRHISTITDQIPNMFEEGLFTDVTLSINGEHLKAHRLILASCSSYFLQIFQEADRNHVDHPFVVLLNVDIDDVKAILAFMYKGECCVYKERIPRLLATAKYLKVHGLSEMKISDYVEPVEQVNHCNEEKLDRNDLPNLKQILVNENQSIGNGNRRDIPETCKCFVCGKYLSNQYNLRVHMETHEETYHACNSCPHVSRSRDALRKHMSYRHPDKYNMKKQKKLIT